VRWHSEIDPDGHESPGVLLEDRGRERPAGPLPYLFVPKLKDEGHPIFNPGIPALPVHESVDPGR
jgi:hypothetical protein